jgi:phage tail sheath protein|nr:MAG TPA: tail sheath protein [Caudoviricetes sp.]DAW41483.1 MAG TPA: tail sheath protein [Caudoviricetes sp.]
MALGGGVFLTQNKVLPGSYINFVSAAKASASLSDRGIATMPLVLDWGKDEEVFEVTSADFQKNSRDIFGYDYASDKLKGLRDLFLNAKTLFAYKLNKGEKAANTFATAKYSGERGNALKVVVKANADTPSNFDVALYLDNEKVDAQTVSKMADLKDNAFVDWKKGATLAVNAGLALTGGTNGSVTAANHQKYLERIESYSFNAMGVVTTDEAVKTLYANFVKRLRDEEGIKFQTVLHKKPADFEGVINVKNTVKGEGADIVYWVTGLQAGCAVNKSCLNRKYDGEYEVNADFSQSELKASIKAGEFVLHKVGDEIRVLSDINSLVTVSDTKGEIFKENQTIRVIDQIANDIAVLFNSKYLGNIPNDADGRVSLWADIVKHHEELQKIRAIENFSDKDVTVGQGDSKKGVVVADKVTVVNAMAQLYMTVTVA